MVHEKNVKVLLWVCWWKNKLMYGIELLLHFYTVFLFLRFHIVKRQDMCFYLHSFLFRSLPCSYLYPLPYLLLPVINLCNSYWKFAGAEIYPANTMIVNVHFNVVLKMILRWKWKLSDACLRTLSSENFWSFEITIS